MAQLKKTNKGRKTSAQATLIKPMSPMQKRHSQNVRLSEIAYLGLSKEAEAKGISRGKVLDQVLARFLKRVLKPAQTARTPGRKKAVQTAQAATA